MTDLRRQQNIREFKAIIAAELMIRVADEGLEGLSPYRRRKRWLMLP